jgi:transcriptional regulator GlxA family with amidase domain
VELSERDIAYSAEYEWKLNALTLRLIVQLIESGYLVIDNDAGEFSNLAQIQAVLNRLITRPEEKFSMQEAARMACMSYSNFSRTFTTIIGRSFVDYCNDTKVHRAEELLKSTNMSITEISHKLGFGSISYFNRIFKSYNGSTPMQYRETK